MQLIFFTCFFFLRYATTLVTSEVKNPEHESREVFLTVILPDTAFISRFAIEVAGELFVAFVKEKEEAWREYQNAVSKGKTAGQISVLFSFSIFVSVTITCRSTITSHPRDVYFTRLNVLRKN